eukprot:3548858-Pleurochrysis_carterae.AAC.1
MHEGELFRARVWARARHNSVRGLVPTVPRNGIRTWPRAPCRDSRALGAESPVIEASSEGGESCGESEGSSRARDGETVVAGVGRGGEGGHAKRLRASGRGGGEVKTARGSNEEQGCLGQRVESIRYTQKYQEMREDATRSTKRDRQDTSIARDNSNAHSQELRCDP